MYVCACSYDACVCYMRMQACVRTHWSTEGNLGEVCSPLISSQELDLGG